MLPLCLSGCSCRYLDEGVWGHATFPVFLPQCNPLQLNSIVKATLMVTPLKGCASPASL